MGQFDPSYLHSEIFKISVIEEGRQPFYVHKALLASQSPELANHVINDMKEGKEREMTLHDVDYITMQKFLEWAYTKYYNLEQTGAAALLVHTKIYVFADRFNIKDLQDLVYPEITQILEDIRIPEAESPEHEFIVQSFQCAFENLVSKQERLLDFLALYAAWGLLTFRQIAAYRKLWTECSAFSVAVLDAIIIPNTEPWSVLYEREVLRGLLDHGEG